MTNEGNFFQYCQKIVILSKDKQSVLLCQRQGEEDYNNIYTFAGGKMEVIDGDIIEGLQREKNEELGVEFRIKILPKYSINTYYLKKDGNSMIVPHYLAIHHSGEIILGEEYSNYKWVSLISLPEFKPQIDNMPEITEELIRLFSIVNEDDFIEI